MAPAHPGDEVAPGFHFSVSVFGSLMILSEPFQEVSGLTSGLETEEVVEGGENRFAHMLPKPPSGRRLKLRRAINSSPSLFKLWCFQWLENGLMEPRVLASLHVALLNAQHLPMINWVVEDAYPLKWEADGFDATKNELAFESIELAYHGIRRF